MSSITQLRQTTVDELADVSGAPRPVLPPGRPASAEPAPVLELRPGGRTPATGVLPHDPPVAATAGPRTVPGGVDAETVRRISGIARSVAQGALEVLAGTRALQQLARWLDPENYERLQLRADLVRCVHRTAGRTEADRRSTPRRVVIRSVRVCPISADVYETSVVAFEQTRVRAVALRVERRRGDWRITALEIG